MAIIVQLMDSTTVASISNRIMVRSEFDPVHLCVNDSGHSCCDKEYPHAFTRYRVLLVNTHAHITLKLNESKPFFVILIGISHDLFREAVNFFRLPIVGYTILQNILWIARLRIGWKITRKSTMNNISRPKRKKKKKTVNRFKMSVRSREFSSYSISTKHSIHHR